MTRAITSEIRNSSTIGIASISMVMGSVDGVATAAKTNVRKMIQDAPLRQLPRPDDPGQVEHDDEQRDLERDPEHQEHPDHELR